MAAAQGNALDGPLGPGVYPGLPEHVYHGDPAAPSLSATIAALICNHSPRHGWVAHPRLNPDFQRVEKAHFDLGTVAHAILLEGNDERCHVVDAPDWRTNTAQDERDEARRRGCVPLLTHQFEAVSAMVAGARSQLDALDVDPPPFRDGLPEQSLIWEDQGVLCRGRLDWLHADLATIDDLKTTSGSARPDSWARRQLWDMGADIQTAMYVRGLKALTGRDAELRFVLVETSPPYGLSIVQLAPSALDLANAKLDYVLAKWRECVATDTWPSYPRRIAYADAPVWEEERFVLMRQLEAEEAAV